jgi:hypothetical protein
VHGAALLAVGADVGSLPRLAYGGTLAGALLLGPWRFEGYGAYWPDQTARSSRFPSVGANVRLALGGARACVGLLAAGGVLELGPCAGVEVGSMHGQGYGVSVPLPADSLWVAATADARASLRLTPALRVVFDLGIAVPFRRDVFFLDLADNVNQASDVHQASPVVGRALLGPELRF